MYTTEATARRAALLPIPPQDHPRRRCAIQHRHEATAGHPTHQAAEAADHPTRQAAEAAVREDHIHQAEATVQDHPHQDQHPPLLPLPPQAEALQAEEGKHNRYC